MILKIAIYEREKIHFEGTDDILSYIYDKYSGQGLKGLSAFPAWFSLAVI